MATAIINTDMCQGFESLRVGVVLPTSPEHADHGALAVEGCEVKYISALNREPECFTFDQVVTADTMESFHSELLQPLTEFLSSGFNITLLLCGTPTEMVEALTEKSILRQVLANLSGCTRMQERAESFISVSFLQFYPDGNAVDLFSLNKETLQLVTHPVLGSVVEGLCEVCVSSAEEAFDFYKICRETMKTNTESISSRCSCLFSVTAEWKLHPQQVESDVCRSKLQLFSLAGGASRTDLRGVIPLLKILDHNPPSSVSDSLLNALLKDALTGNNRTFLIYCITSQGFVDDETQSALHLAQKVRGLVTKPTSVRWNPKRTEQELRESILELQNVMLLGENQVHNIYKLAQLTQNLKTVKNQSWEKRREESEKIKVKIKKSSVSPQMLSADFLFDHKDDTETAKYLQERLRQEMEEHIKEGKDSAEKVQERVTRIQKLKEALREESLKNRNVLRESQLPQQSQLEYNEAQERRRQLKEDHMRLIQEEVAKMERDLAQEQPPTESPQRELLVLSRERQILLMHIEALRAEAQQAESDLQEQHHRHQTELHCLREESLQVFRVFREVSEEQRKISEGRYRSVLLEAVQDAIYLSAQNQQLQAENKQLKKALGEMKDALAVRGSPATDQINQQQ
ncbi:PREDICTED: chromosome-associated kinesin KIF4-like [Cyprinodon variegatus]|uniref:chromosome-associated kinesin KIF4-like n=1 Tax=Cyprinodon variegatus TaxID=28743 RepID=UPI0007427166|nr:PREDICTED: chromosome-associated kinesin KIF4-like [Cyprinodon variegatus]